MGQNTAIEWTDHTFNPWVGCTKVSDGCKNCYAEREMDKRLHFVEWGPQGQRRRTSVANWELPRKWNERCRKLGIRERVFCASLADIFEGRADLDQHRSDVFRLIDETPYLNWLLLTKRPQNVGVMIPQQWWKWPRHVWLGTSIEDQETADSRISFLSDSPAAQTFLSIEPLLGPVDLYMAEWEGRAADWVIVGGESGPNARPMHPSWVQSIRDQCVEAKVPFFFKQWGEWLPISQYDGKAIDCEYVDLRHDGAVFSGSEPVTFCCADCSTEELMRVGKKLAGRLLDGRTWDELPESLQPQEAPR
jgi:protein gp37